jgi:hypothetical protein
MAKETKDEIRKKRGFQKISPSCTNCNHGEHQRGNGLVCKLDGYATKPRSYCVKHEVAEG